MVGALLLLVCPAPLQEKASASSAVARSAMDNQIFEPTENSRMGFRKVLFATNRKIDRSAEMSARVSGGILRYDKLFRNDPDVPATFGWTLMSYPTNRRPGDQSYTPDSSRQNPLFDFSIVDHFIFRTVEDFQTNLKSLRRDGRRSLVYVPGIDNSFNDGAETLTQLAVDLDLDQTPVLFSWPSDHLRLRPQTPIFGLSPESYLKTTQIASASTSYLRLTMDQLKTADTPFDVLAHSMGSDIVVKAISGTTQSDAPLSFAATPNVVEGMPTLILAAPDVSTKEFTADLRPELTKRTKHIAIYCSNDLALVASAHYRRSDERLGYCPDPKEALDGVEMIWVTGAAKDFANHSYYIRTPDILRDLRRVLLTKPEPGARIFSPKPREIRVP